MGRSIVPIVLFTALGCQSGTARSNAAQTPDTTTPVTSDTAPDEATPLWSREGLETQPWLDRLRNRIPADLEYEPGTTAWSPADVELPDTLTDADLAPFDTPGDVLTAVVRGLGWDAELGDVVWEQALRVWRESPDSAVGAVLRWGFQDDAIAGHDILVQLRRGGGGWYVEGVEERYHCARRVSPEDLCS